MLNSRHHNAANDLEPEDFDFDELESDFDFSELEEEFEPFEFEDFDFDELESDNNDDYE